MKKTTQALPANLTKVSYILEKTDKKRLEQTAKREGCSMSEIITRALHQFYVAARKSKKAA